ncbi:up-regulator of cell proliferation-like isoform X1 [Chrysemys picta bellii]|uniref:up-regulator of cell proliferation-like isoform X1 n=1 Tax=Chrysemys picta bellii TaxID=8478 RepID=UPI0032B13215
MEKTGSSNSLLLETLDDLGEDDLKRFKHKLKRIQLEKGYQAIPWGRLEKGDPVDVTDLLIRHYGERYGVEVAVQVLREIKHRALAERLTEAISADLLRRKQNSDTPQAPELGEKGDFNPEQESETQRHPEPEERDISQERRRATQGVLEKLNLEQYRSRQLRLRDLQEINPESIKNWALITLGDLPWHFLRKVMALNGTARSTRPVHGASDDQESNEVQKAHVDYNNLSLSNMDSSNSLHSLDVLCAVLLCSDSFLQQEILSKMSMCQFALPLLLPALETPKCTLMLWAMRDIVRKWRPHSLAESRGFREESLVLTAMPTISFVRLGSCSFSKSKLLNEVLSPSEQHHDFFIHRDMESGNIPREIADGLVEISWYFPAGKENSDLFPEPVAVTNLRGDIESHWLQFSFLTEVSSAVFIVTESINERQYTLLSSLQGSATKYYFIFNCKIEKPEETLQFLYKLESVLKLDKLSVLMRENTLNHAQFVEKLQLTIGSLMESSLKRASVADTAATARELGIWVDEDSEECQSASKRVAGITAEIKDVAKYKREMLRLPGSLCKKLAKAEKELFRMQQQGDAASGLHASQQREEWLDLYTRPDKCELTDGMVKFITGLGKLSQVETHYFLKWMKYHLGHIAQGNLSSLQADYKEKCHVRGDDPQHRAKLHEPISSSSLGVEHFMRGLGQFYEAECAMVKEGKKLKTQRQLIHLPGIAADLMLEGFPLELIDGDVSNIPLHWVTDVLTQLHAKLGGRSRMLVLTVLGGQSTGKSTLLNTMFGLQFAVSSGRCTRGAFMSVIKVAENFRQELGCDVILVIDTEGLKAPELAKLEDSYQHDNELATLVIGLSDITIVNMAMENATEMKGVLQITLDTLLKMKKIRQHPNCQFVHQNVSDVSAHEQNTGDGYQLLEPLDEMTIAAACTEKGIRKTKFPGIIHNDAEKYNWYIPGLWHGVPPMAPVNMEYSESVFELKKYLIEFMRRYSSNRPLKDIPQFSEWVRSLWNAIKHSNSTFSLRNSFVAHSYNQLFTKYSEWEWDFRKEMHLWVSEQETFIQNQPQAEVDHVALSRLNRETWQKLQQEERRVLDSLQNYIGSGAANVLLTGQYREDFIRSTNGLTKELGRYWLRKCEEALDHQSSPERLNHQIQAVNMKTMKGKADGLLGHCRKRNLSTFPKGIRIFCEACLRPALVDYVNRMLGIKIVDNFRKSAQGIGYGNRSFFQFWMLSRLLEEMNFDGYVKYINNYEEFAKTWIWTHLLDHYKETRGVEDLERELLSTVIKKIRDALENSKTQTDFLGSFFKYLQRDLVISRDRLARIQLINTTTPNQFPIAVQDFLPALEQAILSQFKDLDVESKFSILSLKPQEEIFKHVFGCGKCCPFCKVPCEAEGTDHKIHFASVHRPQGLMKPKRVFLPCLAHGPKLDYSPCYSGWLIRDSHIHIGYRHCFCEDNSVLPCRAPADSGYKTSNYWKFVFKAFNQQFAREYGTKPADLPGDWDNVTQEQALKSLEEAFKGAISVPGQNWLQVVQKKPKVFP